MSDEIFENNRRAKKKFINKCTGGEKLFLGISLRNLYIFAKNILNSLNSKIPRVNSPYIFIYRNSLLGEQPIYLGFCICMFMLIILHHPCSSLCFSLRSSLCPIICSTLAHMLN